MASVLQSRVASLTHRLRWSVKGLAVGCLRSFASGSGKAKDSLADSALRDRIDAILPREGPAVIRLTSTDVYDNLAFEEWLGQQTDLAQRGVMMLWINAPCVVIGRNQNAWHECNLRELHRKGVALARRHSGGGTVFHDLHNLNITFLSTRDGFSKQGNSDLLAGAINTRGNFSIPEITINDRTDLVMEGRKLSGSAYRLGSTTAFHHCTLLVGTDLAALGAVLGPSVPGIVTKGIPSVKSPVCSLGDPSYMPLIQSVISDAYLDHNGVDSTKTVADSHRVTLCATELAAASEHLGARRDTLRSWEWVFSGPQWHVPVPLGDTGSVLTLHVNKGHMVRAEVEGELDGGGLLSEKLTSYFTSTPTPFYHPHLVNALASVGGISLKSRTAIESALSVLNFSELYPGDDSVRITLVTVLTRRHFLCRVRLHGHMYPQIPLQAAQSLAPVVSQLFQGAQESLSLEETLSRS